MPDDSKVTAGWADLAGEWQRLGSEWQQWWNRSVSTVLPQASTALPCMTPNPATFLPAGQVTALAAKYQPRFQALWVAAQEALLNPAAASVPQIAQELPGDRRFAAPE